VSSLKIKISSKNMREKPTNTPIRKDPCGGMLLEDGNVMPKHAGATIHNY
jgi:hypothetical protein